MAPRAFVVDDEKSIATTTTQILRLSGYDARSFLDPLETLEAARADCPDLVVADVMMPHLSGIDLAVYLKEMCPNCKLVLFSGQAETASLLDAASERVMNSQFWPNPFIQLNCWHAFTMLWGLLIRLCASSDAWSRPHTCFRWNCGALSRAALATSCIRYRPCIRNAFTDGRLRCCNHSGNWALSGVMARRV
jgi:CheY-like chemotaxis protein